MLTAILLTVYDSLTSVWLINYSGLVGCCSPDGSQFVLGESNPLIADENGKINLTRLLVLVPLGWACIVAMGCLYKFGQKPDSASHASFTSLYKCHKAFPAGLLCLYGVIYMEIFVAFVNNSYMWMTIQFDLPIMSSAVYGLLLCAVVFCPALYTYHAVLWRFLTDEAKAKHHYLAWPYRKGWMHEQNLSLT